MCYRYLLFCLLFSLLPGSTWSQSEQVWAFGFHAGLDFNTGIPVPIQTAIDGWGEANASVSGAMGNLLFYTEGNSVWGQNNTLMANGSNLTPIPPCLTASFSEPVNTSSAAQGAAIIPMPGRMSRYYIFSLTAFECDGKAGRLYYSIVDMTLNKGLGDLIPGQKGILVDTGLTEKMIAVSGNNCNVWVLVQAKNGDLKAYEISEAGVQLTPVISALNRRSASLIGNIIVSPDRRKLGLTNIDMGDSDVGALLYDFDPNSGSVSNGIELCEMGRYAYGICFSGNSSKLYVNYGTNSGSGAMYQYDLSPRTPEEILASQTFIDTMLRIGQIRLGPDGKIYFTGASFFTTFLGSINAPDLLGKACEFHAANIPLAGGSAAKLGLPNGIPLIQGSRDSQYVQHRDTVPCFANSYLLKTDTSALNVLWDDGSTENTRLVRKSGSYRVQYRFPESKCLLRIDSHFVHFRNDTLPEIKSSPSCINAATGSAWLYFYSRDTTDYQYFWLNSVGDTLSANNKLEQVSSGRYQLLIHTPHCDTSVSFFIPQVNYNLAFYVDSIICQGEQVLFNNTSDTGFHSFYWDFADQMHSALNSPYHSYLHPGIFRVLFTGSSPICTDTIYKTIQVDSLFPASFLMEPHTICTGEPVQLLLSTDSSLSYIDWAFGDETAMVSGWEKNIQHAYANPGVFPVTLSAHFRACPESSFTDTVRVMALPTIDLEGDTALCLNGPPIILKNRNDMPRELYTYHWNTGDSLEQLKVVHPGVYSLTLRYRLTGCSATESAVVSSDCYINIPNAFSPNEDGTNDSFFPRQLMSKNVTKFHMQVFNRWGELIFETNQVYGKGWDGKFNGIEQPSGVYLYFIQVETNHDMKENYRGNITLMR